MDRPEPEEIVMKISDVRAQYHALSNRVYRGEIRVIIEKSGIQVAAIVSPEDMKTLERLDERDRLREEYEERKRAESRKALPTDDSSELATYESDGPQPDSE